MDTVCCLGLLLILIEQMKKYMGFGDNGEPVIEDCKLHVFSELPGRGLARDMSGVGLFEPVIISRNSFVYPMIASACEKEIKRRAEELGAYIHQMVFPAACASDMDKICLWFSTDITLHLQP